MTSEEVKWNIMSRASLQEPPDDDRSGMQVNLIDVL